MQDQFTVPDGIVVNHSRLCKTIGNKSKVLACAVVTLVQVDVEYIMEQEIQFVVGFLLIRLFNSYYIKPVKHALWKHEADHQSIFL